jgi:hypothetical protein
MLLGCFFLFLFSFYFFDTTNIFSLYYLKEKKVISIEKEEEEMVPVKKQEKYEDKYLEKSKQMNRHELSLEELKQLKNNVILEKTPVGNVLMLYNNEKESFSYYSDFSLPYRYLETIARKYIITFDCAYLYIFADEELEKLSIIQEEKKEIVKENKSSSVFAKFKTYNTNNSITTTISQPIKQYKIQAINMRQIPIKEKTNRYTHEGKLGNYSFLKSISAKDINKKLQISYSDYKNKLCNNNG